MYTAPGAYSNMLLEQSAFPTWSWSIFDLENFFRLLMVKDRKSRPKSPKSWLNCLSLFTPTEIDSNRKQQVRELSVNQQVLKVIPNKMDAHFISLREWMWCHCLIYVRHDKDARAIVSSRDNTHLTTKRCNWKDDAHVEEALRRHVHSQSGVKIS